MKIQYMMKLYNNRFLNMRLDTSIKRVVLAGALILMIALQANAQRGGQDMQQIQDAKVSMISNRLNLTPDQSEKFWPVYNDYSEKRRELRRAQRKIINEKRSGGLTDKAALESLKEVQELKQKEVDLEKQYQEKFLTIISPLQLTELQSAEKSFNDMLLQRLDRKRD
jgi:Spy/CpxP family protein refolding chaperone